MNDRSVVVGHVQMHGFRPDVFRKRDEENCLPCKSLLTKQRRDSTLENDVGGACSISIFRSRDFSAGFLPTSASEVARGVLAIAI